MDAIVLLTSGSRKKGVEFKGGSLHDGFGGFDGSGERLTLLLLILQNIREEQTRLFLNHAFS